MSNWIEKGEVTTITLGGTNLKTGQPNPTQLEGYYLRREEKENKYNKKVPQSYYVFQTKDGDVGIYGKASVDKGMKSATVGTMTKVVATGEEIDTGKGNPMKVFRVFQDPTNTIDTSNLSSGPETDDNESDDDNEYVSSPAVTNKGPNMASNLSPANASAQDKIKAMLANRSKSA